MYPSVNKHLVNGYLACGAIGITGCLLLHHSGGSDARIPISVEFSNSNPLAILFLFVSFSAAAIAGTLYWRLNRRAEAVVLYSIASCLIVTCITSMQSLVHGLALLLIVLATPLPAFLHMLRSDITILQIAVLAFAFSITYIFGLVTILPGTEVGLGIAERVWFVVAYLSNAYFLGLPNLRAGIES